MAISVQVSHLPRWLDVQRLVGPEFEVREADSESLQAVASLSRCKAADVQARLRGVCLGGQSLVVSAAPTLARKYVRAARAEDARRRRDASVGFCKAGVRLDREARVSLTPEQIALNLGERVARCRVLDVCCGAGGNAIGFARAGCDVIALELNPARMAMAQHNAKVYGVSKSISFFHADARDGLRSRDADVLYIDPPWGEEWNRQGVSISDFPLVQRLLADAKHFSRIWMKLPPSFDVMTLPLARPEAVFGIAPGDYQRVKFLLLEILSPT